MMSSRDARQLRVFDWCVRAFGEIARDTKNRVGRVVEEAVELAQAEGMDEAQAHKIVTYVFGRPKGEVSQEVGGVGVTLLAYCEAKGISADSEEHCETTRVLTTDIERFRRRQAEKVAAGV